ncbi:MAG: hypothetical protein D6718_06590 [Acidobacteria bacterium]|nr:MAG: hypothetical protein D6718_06590 [Acidobacteriota bacterium]
MIFGPNLPNGRWRCAAALAGLLAAGALASAPAGACVTCDDEGRSCPEVLGDGAAACDIDCTSVDADVECGWLKRILGLCEGHARGEHCDCTPVGSCKKAKDPLEPEEQGLGPGASGGGASAACGLEL